MLIPEDELQATLAELESMSEEEIAAIPSLDDGHDPTDELASDRDALDVPAASSPDTREVSAETSAGVSVPEAQTDAAPDGLETAAVVEAPSAGPAATETPPVAEEPQPGPEPAAEQAQAGEAPPEPADDLHSDDTAQPAEAQAQAGESAAEDAQPSTVDGPPSRASRSEVGEEPAEGSAPGTAAQAQQPEAVVPAEQHESAAPHYATRPVPPLAKRIYRAVDHALDTINRPFAWLNETARTLVGWVAVTTLIVSILAIVLMPVLFPHRDAITFLQEKVAQLDPPPPPVEQVEKIAP